MKSVSGEGTDILSRAGTAGRGTHSNGLTPVLRNLQNISRIFVNLSRGGSWQVESPAARFGPLADVSLGPHGVDLVVGELE